jgi:hypothetical protein
MALTGQGGQSGGPQYGWGGVPNDPGAGARTGSGGSRTNFNSGLNSGRYTAGPEAGMRRGAWQWSGHGPSAQRDYGWDYQGGVGRDEITQRTEARDGGSYLSHMAQDRGGGLPRYHDDYDAGDRWFPRPGEREGNGFTQNYDRGFRGGMAGSEGGGMYDRGYQASGGYLGGSGNRYGRGDTGFRGGLAPAFGGQYGIGNDYADRYDQELRARGGGGIGSGNRYGADFGGGGAQMDRGGGQQVTYGFGESRGGYSRAFGARQGGGGYGRDFGQGRALSGRGGGYGGDYRRPLTDDEFYSRVNRW